MRARIPHVPGSFARVAAAIGQTAILGAIVLVRVEGREVIRDVTVACADADHGEAVVRAVRGLEGVAVEAVSDRPPPWRVQPRGGAGRGRGGGGRRGGERRRLLAA